MHTMQFADRERTLLQRHLPMANTYRLYTRSSCCCCTLSLCKFCDSRSSCHTLRHAVHRIIDYLYRRAMFSASIVSAGRLSCFLISSYTDLSAKSVPFLFPYLSSTDPHFTKNELCVLAKGVRVVVTSVVSWITISYVR
jgi:hypothetical protein